MTRILLVVTLLLLMEHTSAYYIYLKASRASDRGLNEGILSVNEPDKSVKLKTKGNEGFSTDLKHQFNKVDIAGETSDGFYLRVR